MKKAATGAAVGIAVAVAVGPHIGVAALGTAIAGTWVLGLLLGALGAMTALALPQLRA